MEQSEASKTDIEQIYERIINAIMEHRLSPGSKLGEVRMAEAFGVSRTKVRQVLMMLAKTGLVEQFPNRGAFIASPSVSQTLEIFATRRLLEPVIVSNVIARAERQDLKRLHQQIAKEKDARKQRNRQAIIRLSGDFHMLLASMAGNRYIEKMMGELCPLTCLTISLYDAPHTPACPEDEHDQIVAAIARRDESAAIELMLHHLHHIEGELQLDAVPNNNIDWNRIFG